MKPVSIILLCLFALAACAPAYRPNPGNPYDFKGDLNNIGGLAPTADTPKKSWLDSLFG